LAIPNYFIFKPNMSHSAHTDEEQMKERYDSQEVVNQKIQRLVEMIKASNHMICFTGAGISTSAGIPDFRGPKGKWTREAKGLKPIQGVPTISAYPTKTHMSLVKLARENKLKWLISQNCDGLHVRSGFPQDRISELHGNGNAEICEQCGQRYFRDMSCYRITRGRDHFTGRYCVRNNCEGRLLNSTIDFGQNLPQTPLNYAFYHSEKADLCIALGSSLTVTPAADCPGTVAENENANLVIINLQKTPLTNAAAFQIFAKTDEVMERVMWELGYDIPEFRLVRKLIVGCDPENDVYYCRGADVDDPSLEMDFVRDIFWGTPYPQDAEVDNQEQNLETFVAFNGFTHDMEAFGEDIGDSGVFVDAQVEFVGHYREPSLVISNDFTAAYLYSRRVEYLWTLEYNPYTTEWVSVCELSNVGKSNPPNDDSYGKSHAEYCINGMQKCGKSKSEAKKLWKLHVKRTSKQYQGKNKATQIRKKQRPV